MRVSNREHDLRAAGSEHRIALRVRSRIDVRRFVGRWCGVETIDSSPGREGGFWSSSLAFDEFLRPQECALRPVMVNRISLAVDPAREPISGRAIGGDLASGPAADTLFGPESGEEAGTQVHPTALAIGALIGIVFGVVAALSVCAYVMWWVQGKLRSDSPQDETFLESLSALPPRFSYKDLEMATKSFEKQLGAGGFGCVYEGTLANGAKVAVKKLHVKRQSSKDFRAEVATVGGIHHKNLVRLRGFCAEGSERLLVYEYAANASLDKWLFPSRNYGEVDIEPRLLDWSQRFNIALGTAKGLAYLHGDCGRRIVHFDIKPQNILLDENFEPKVADFGLSKITDRHNSTSAELVTTMRGTPGYVAPEWMLGVGVTEKGDVYSYGMVLFELVSGRRNLDASLSESVSFYFPALAVKVVKEDGYGRQGLNKIVDPRLQGRYDEDQARKFLQLALWCIQVAPKDRPQMREVVLMLEGTLIIPEPPVVKFSGVLQAQKSLSKELLQTQRSLSQELVESRRSLSLTREQLEQVQMLDSPTPNSLESLASTSCSSSPSRSPCGSP